MVPSLDSHWTLTTRICFRAKEIERVSKSGVNSKEIFPDCKALFGAPVSRSSRIVVIGSATVYP